MPPSRKAGFILPFALFIAMGLIGMSLLLLQWEVDSASRHLTARLHQRAQSTLLLNAPRLLQELDQRLEDGMPASALLHRPEMDPAWVEPVLLDPVTGRPAPLHSEAVGEPGSPLTFSCPFGERLFMAEEVPLLPESKDPGLTLAWAAQDIQLLPPEAPPPAFWPLPRWDLAPLITPATTGPDLHEILGEAGWTGPWVPEGEALPFIPESSPALAPVVRELALRFGVFAAGPPRSREKTIRVRFYLEGDLWNPYHRPLRLHPGTASRPVFQVIFWNLPEIRLHNRSLGQSSAWIPLDAAPNAQTGSTGLYGWIRGPGLLAAGASFPFSEPDPHRQPEGLARTLHPGFPVGPADRIEVEWRAPSGGLYAACLPMSGGDALDHALADGGWFRAEAFPAEWPSLLFARADSGPRPFLLPGGSLSFRRENAHLRVAFRQAELLRSATLDPRRHRIVHHEPVPTAGMEEVTGSALLDLAIIRSPPPASREAGAEEPLFSWPDRPPAHLGEAMDLPGWAEGFRLGSEEALRLNTLMETHPQAFFRPPPEALVSLLDSEGRAWPFLPAWPVNQISPEAWARRLRDSALAHPPQGLRFGAYPFPGADPDDLTAALSPDQLEEAITSLVEATALAPFSTVPGFFNAGSLAQVMPASASHSLKHAWMPLRGWLRRASIPRPQGSAWILHLAVRAGMDGQTAWKTARLWLMKAALPGENPRLHCVRFEWTHPQEHLLTPQTKAPAGPG